MIFTSLSCSGSDEVSFLFFLAISSAFVSLRNAICLPSGDHTGSPAPRGRSVITQASPPDRESRASCVAGGLPSFGGSTLPRTNAIHFPSGDQRGWESRLPVVRRTGVSVPAVETIHSAVS